MEKQLFEWENWDDGGEGLMIFYGCCLKAEVGEFGPGTLFGMISVDYNKGTLALYGQDGGQLSEHKLKLSVE